MGQIQVSKDGDAIVSFFEDKLSSLEDKSSELIGNITDAFGAIATVTSPIQFGGLRDSIYQEYSGLEGIVNATAEYFPYVILGTQPHSIGSSVYMYGVWRYIGLSPLGNGTIHPGTQANDFMQEAFDSGDSMVDQMLEEFGSWLIE